MPNKRNAALDLTRAIAIFCVIVIHTCIPGYSAAGFDRAAAIFWGSLTRMAVPLFFMCSGALLLNPDKTISAARFFRRNFLRIVIALFFWAAVYKLFHLTAQGELSRSALVQAGKELLLFKHENHFYYLHIMLLVYAFLPMLRLLTRYADRKLLLYLLTLWALLGIVYPTVRPFWPFSLLTGVPTQWMMNMTYASLGYALLGYFIRKYPIKKGLAACSYLLGFSLTFGLTMVMSRDSLYTGFFEGMSIGVALQAVGLFALIPHIELRGTAARLSAYISHASFCVYLVHLLVMDIAAALGWSVLLLPCAVSIPLAALVTLTLCCGVYFILSKLPFVKSYLV